MSKIILKKPVRKFLEIETENEKIKLFIKPVLIKDLDEQDSFLILIKNDFNTGKLSLIDYLSKTINQYTNDFKIEYFDFLEIEYIDLIVEKLKSLQQTNIETDLQASRISKFRILKLMRCGFSLNEISNMELNELDDWLEAESALEIDDRLKAMNVASFPNAKNRNGVYQNLSAKQLMALGENPFTPSDERIIRDREKTKKQKHLI